jgi:MYXO-CTERM domain-containing protein
VPELQTGDALVANFTTYERDDLTHESSNTTATVEYVTAEASVGGDTDIDGDGDEEVTVRNSTEQEIAGQTSLAPGREVTVRLSGSDPGAPVTELLQTRVRSDGAWNVSADFSDIPAGTNFTVDVLLGSESLLDSPVDARVVARAAAETDDPTTERATDTDQEPTTDEPTDADPATASEPTETDTTAPTSDTETTGTTAATANAETPGLGPIHAVVALLAGGALVAFRRRR